MSGEPTLGMSLSELEADLRWQMRKAPSDPAHLVEYMGKVFVSLIDKNNRAIAKSLAEREQPDLPEDY